MSVTQTVRKELVPGTKEDNEQAKQHESHDWQRATKRPQPSQEPGNKQEQQNGLSPPTGRCRVTVTPSGGEGMKQLTHM